MNLYQIMIRHYAPKDYEDGIYTYLVAESDEDVYEWVKEESQLKDGRYLFNIYKDAEEDGDMLDDVPFKDSIIASQGCMYNDCMEVSDLYYGATQIGWKMVKEDISQDEVDVIEGAGVSIEIAKGDWT